MIDECNELISKQFQKILDRHGYGFQYASLKVAQDLFDNKQVSWLFEAAEFPVQVVGKTKGTRIDFILRAEHAPYYLLVECKRVNPALRHWCFARAPYVRRDRLSDSLISECLVRDGDLVMASGRLLQDLSDETAYHIALEVKSKDKGDSQGKGIGAIEEAATQVCQGLNGMVEFLAQNPSLVSENCPLFVLPVILTTANLWGSTEDISKANLQTGKIGDSKLQLMPKEWIYLQYHQSPGLKHSIPPISTRQEQVASILDRDYIRSIAIVSAPAIQKFLVNFQGAFRSYMDPY